MSYPLSLNRANFVRRENDDIVWAKPSANEYEKPKPGDVVTFSFEKYSQTTGVPTVPRILRIRKDLEWADVLRGSAPTGKTPNGLFIFAYIRYSN